jgi:hypothetical protein
MQQSSNPARLYEIVVVVIRILAIKLALDAIGYLPYFLAQHSRDLHPQIGFILFGIVAFCAYWLWQFSPFLARHITRGQDSTLDCGSLALSDLYTFAFLLVGLYFAVDSFGSSLAWFHYTLRQSSSVAALSQQDQVNYYTLFKYLVKLFLGLALIFNGRKFATKLIKRQDETV